jgi:hypothetical protein
MIFTPVGTKPPREGNSSHDPFRYVLGVNEEMFVNLIVSGGCHGRDRIIVGFTTTCAIIAYHH